MAYYSQEVIEAAQKRLDELKHKRLVEGLSEEEFSLYRLLLEVINR